MSTAKPAVVTCGVISNIWGLHAVEVSPSLFMWLGMPMGQVLLVLSSSWSYIVGFQSVW